LLKLNSSGSVIWAKSNFAPSFSIPHFNLFQDSLGIFGIITSDNSSGDSTKIFEIDSSGTSSWCRILPGNFYGKNLKRLSDGRLVFSGSNNGAGLFFMDSLGNCKTTSIGINNNVGDITDYIQTGDGFLVITMNANYGILKFDSLGNGLCTTLDSLTSNPDTISFQIDTVTDSYIAGSTPTTLYLIDNIEVFDSTCELQTYGIKEIIEDKNVVVFPNPSNDKFNIKSTTGEFERSTITIYNSIGKIIFSGLMENVSSVELKPGVYELSVLSPNGHFAHKKLIRL